MEKLIVIGWGRMGITHTSIINGLYPNKFEITIVEPNKIIALIVKKTFQYKVYKSYKNIDFNGCVVLITTPPIFHPEICSEALNNGAKSIFVEKPFGLHNKRVPVDPRISVGYVLRFTEVANTLKNIIKNEGCKKITIDYSSNTLTKPPTGWRNGEYGGVLNEMGSHLLDLVFFLGGNKEFVVNEVIIQSVVSDVDDIVYVNAHLGEIEIVLTLNWVNKEYRKPIWSGILETEKSTISFDQQAIEKDIFPRNVDFYVRGRDFSLQMKHFIEGNSTISCTAYEANKVHDSIMLIKSKR